MATTEPGARRSPLRPPKGVATVAGATTAFAGLSIALALQMGAGNDPALGRTSAVSPAPAVAQRHIVVRRIRRTVIVDVVRDRPDAVGSAPAQAGGTASSAPAASAAPAPVAAAPAPPPAPVVTRTS